MRGSAQQAMAARQVVAERGQQPFGLHLAQSASQELPQTPLLLQRPNDRFHHRLAMQISPPSGRGAEFFSHAQSLAVTHLPVALPYRSSALQRRRQIGVRHIPINAPRLQFIQIRTAMKSAVRQHLLRPLPAPSLHLLDHGQQRGRVRRLLRDPRRHNEVVLADRQFPAIFIFG